MYISPPQDSVSTITQKSSSIISDQPPPLNFLNQPFTYYKIPIKYLIESLHKKHIKKQILIQNQQQYEQLNNSNQFNSYSDKKSSFYKQITILYSCKLPALSSYNYYIAIILQEIININDQIGLMMQVLTLNDEEQQNKNKKQMTNNNKDNNNMQNQEEKQQIYQQYQVVYRFDKIINTNNLPNKQPIQIQISRQFSLTQDSLQKFVQKHFEIPPPSSNIIKNNIIPNLKTNPSQSMIKQKFYKSLKQEKNKQIYSNIYTNISQPLIIFQPKRPTSQINIQKKNLSFGILKQQKQDIQFLLIYQLNWIVNQMLKQYDMKCWDEMIFRRKFKNVIENIIKKYHYMMKQSEQNQIFNCYQFK